MRVTLSIAATDLLTTAVDGKAPTAEDTLERPMARVEKFQPVWELRVDM